MARKYAAALAGQDEPEFDDPDPVRGWAAQYLNVWPLLLGPASDALVMPNWPLCATTNVQPPVTRIGIAADPDLVWASIGACGETGGRRHLGAVLRRRVDVDESLIVSEAIRIQREHGVGIVVDKKGPAATIGRAVEN